MIRSNSREHTINTDIFGREKFTEKLYTIIDTWGDKGCVFSLNGGWGDGKTTYIKTCLIPKLQSEENKVIYINTFVKDYIENPLLLIAGEISESTYGELEVRENFKNKAQDLLKVIGKVGIRYLLRGDIPEIDNKVESSIEGYIADYVGESLSKYTEEKNAIEGLKELIKEFINSEEKPLTIIIDEIDRCRPDFAIKILEIIKHFFDTDGIVFIISMNKVQIKGYIEKIYGTQISEIYLQKFIDFEVNLEKKLYEYGNNGHIGIYIKEVFRESNVGEVETLMLLLARFNEFNYREINTLFNECIICKKFDTASGFREYILLFLVLKLKKPLIFTKCVSKEIPSGEIVKALNLDRVKSDDEEYYIIEKIGRILNEERLKNYLVNLSNSLSEL